MALCLPLGCGSEVECGPGTSKVDDTCLPDAPGATDEDQDTPEDPAPPAMPVAPAPVPDGGAAPPTAESDAGVPPTQDPPPEPPPTGGPPGCDDASGECDEWASAIAAGIAERQMSNGCALTLTADPRLEGVAQRHAEHQASIDTIDPNSPEGSLFQQIRAAGVNYRDAGVLFAGSREGPDQVLQNWANNASTAMNLARCDGLVGVGVATAAGGMTYVTALLAVE